jgi:LysM repeat protein
MAPVYRRRRIGVMLVLATLVVLGDHAASAVVRAVSPPAAVSATVASADVATAAESTPGVVAATPAMAPVTTRLVVVQPGDTLWSIARSLQPAGDVRQLVDELAQRAGGSGVQAGQRIDVSGLGSLDGDRAPSTAR